MSQHQYVYPAAPPAPRQYSTGHGTSSAFSSSANPDEDWTKISDLAERRRIQNRIAQRNYRKKLKRKLEELERRAENGTPGSEKPAPPTKARKQSSQKAQKTSPGPKPIQATQQYTPPTQHEELLFLPPFDDRERSHTPPMFSYSYPPPEGYLHSYGSSPSYSTVTSAEAYPTYMATTVPVTLPSMTHFSDVLQKRDFYSAEDAMSSYMNYPLIPGIDVSSPPQYDGSNPQTPPLSHSFDHSANCSESGYEYPTTPLSMPGSPGLAQH